MSSVSLQEMLFFYYELQTVNTRLLLFLGYFYHFVREIEHFYVSLCP